jgi:hypothetical protein
MQEVRSISTMTAALLGLGDWLAGLGVSRVGGPAGGAAASTRPPGRERLLIEEWEG